MPEINGHDIRTVVISCDAGMGSSVMVASQMRQRLKKYDVAVEHLPVNSIPNDAQVNASSRRASIDAHERRSARSS